MDAIIDSRIKAVPASTLELAGQKLVYLNLLQSLGYASHQLPLASLLSQLHDLEGDWLILSPIHWQATHNDAMIMAHGDTLSLSEDESRTWFKELSAYLEKDQFELVYHNAEIWLIRKKSMLPIQAKSVYQMFHRSMMPELSALDDTLFWQQFLTETQMFLSSHDLNQARIQEQKPVLNGVWVWGAGHLALSEAVICTVQSFEKMARICSTNVHIYSPQVSLRDINILLLSDLSDLSSQHKEKLTQSSIRWFWNDFSYLSKKRRWWHQLRRKLRHAD